MDTVLRHSLGLRRITASVAALGDDEGLIVAARLRDPGAGVEIEIRLRTLAQVEALMAAAAEAREALRGAREGRDGP